MDIQVGLCAGAIAGLKPSVHPVDTPPWMHLEGTGRGSWPMSLRRRDVTSPSVRTAPMAMSFPARRKCCATRWAANVLAPRPPYAPLPGQHPAGRGTPYFRYGGYCQGTFSLRGAVRFRLHRVHAKPRHLLIVECTR